MKFNDFINTGLLRDLVNKRRFSMKRVITRPAGAYIFRSVADNDRGSDAIKKNREEEKKIHANTDESGKRVA